MRQQRIRVPDQGITSPRSVLHLVNLNQPHSRLPSFTHSLLPLAFITNLTLYNFIGYNHSLLSYHCFHSTLFSTDTHLTHRAFSLILTSITTSGSLKLFLPHSLTSLTTPNLSLLHSFPLTFHTLTLDYDRYAGTEAAASC